MATLVNIGSILLALFGTFVHQSSAQQCDMNRIIQSLPGLQQACCLENAERGDLLAGTAQCSGGYPTTTDTCSKGCKNIMGPFWSQCGAILTASGMPGLDGMAAFDETCKATPSCDMNTMTIGVNHIQDVCCAGGSCGGVYPGADTPCKSRCAIPFQTFWTDCGKTIKAMGMAGSMETFFATCMETLYPPGSCGDVCDASTFQCRLQEVNMACCREDGCKNGSIVPADCSTECALVFVSFRDECATMSSGAFDVGTMSQLDDFKTKCLDQDTTSVVEFAKVLMERGCSIVFDSHRRQLQDMLACVDDPDGMLAALGGCDVMLATFGGDCDFDWAHLGFPAGSTPRSTCPVSCDECNEIKGAQPGSPLLSLQIAARDEACPFDSVYGAPCTR